MSSGIRRRLNGQWEAEVQLKNNGENYLEIDHVLSTNNINIHVNMTKDSKYIRYLIMSIFPYT